MKVITKILFVLGIFISLLGVFNSILNYPDKILIVIGPLIILGSVVIRMAEKSDVNNNLRSRLLRYALLIISSFVIPFILVGVLIGITGDRGARMAFGFVIPFFLLNFVFSFFHIKSNILIKMISGVVVTIITLGFMWIVLYSEVLDSPNFMFEILGVLITFISISISVWEIVFRIIYKNIKKPVNNT